MSDEQLCTYVGTFYAPFLSIGTVGRCMAVARCLRDHIINDQQMWLYFLMTCGLTKSKLPFARSKLLPPTGMDLRQFVHFMTAKSRCIECGGGCRNRRENLHPDHPEDSEYHPFYRLCRSCTGDPKNYCFRISFDDAVHLVNNELKSRSAMGWRVRQSVVTGCIHDYCCGATGLPEVFWSKDVETVVQDIAKGSNVCILPKGALSGALKVAGAAVAKKKRPRK